MWAECWICECWIWWYIKEPLRSKGLIRSLTFNRLLTLRFDLPGLLLPPCSQRAPLVSAVARQTRGGQCPKRVGSADALTRVRWQLTTALNTEPAVEACVCFRSSPFWLIINVCLFLHVYLLSFNTGVLSYSRNTYWIFSTSVRLLILMCLN
jgi:hypothetical protein